jgi:hypothetical protein
MPGAGQAAVPLVGDAREDWQILRALSEVLGVPLPYASLEGVRARLADVAPSFAHVYELEKPLWLNGEYMKVRWNAWPLEGVCVVITDGIIASALPAGSFCSMGVRHMFSTSGLVFSEVFWFWDGFRFSASVMPVPLVVSVLGWKGVGGARVCVCVVCVHVC